MRFFIKYLSIAVAISYPSILFAASPLIIDHNFKESLIGEYAEYYEDTDDTILIEDIINNNVEFIQSETARISFGYDKQNLWFRFSVHNITDKKISLIFEQGYSAVNRFDFYYQDGDTLKKYTSGDKIPFFLRPIYHHNPAFPVTQPPGIRTYYINIETQGALILLLNAMQAKIFEQKREREMVYYGIFIGIIVSLFFINLSLFIATRKSQFLILGFCYIVTAYYALNNDSIAFQFLWPNNFEFNDLFYPFNELTGNLLIILFMKNFRQIPKSFSIFLNVILLITILCYILPFLFGIHLVNILIHTFILTCMIIGYVWCNLFIFPKTPVFKYFFSATTIFAVGAVMEAFRKFNLFDFNLYAANILFAIWGAHFLMALSLLILTFGIIKTSYTSYIAKSSAEEGLIEKMMARENIITEYINTMTHEIATPIQAIILGTGRLKSLCLSEDKFKKSFQTILSNAERLLKVNNQFLMFVRDSGKTKNIIFANEDINDLVKNVIDDQYELVNKYNHEITYHLSENPVVISINRFMIEQAVYNILTNSIKYTPSGGKIIVSVEKNDNQVCIAVIDNGIGIPETEIDNVFDEFFRVDKSVKGREHNTGLGLGLNISKKYIEKHGGAISCKSPLTPADYPELSLNDYRKGTVFFIYLPYQIQEQRNENKKS